MGTSAIERPEKALRLRTLVACNLGVALEGFDFIAYTAFAGILGRLFFPTGDQLSATLLVFAGFGVAYVVRPFGGLFWGVYADRLGRRRALAAIAVLTGLGTAAIALAPPYAAIGMAAPLLVLGARIIQGFAAAGEFASATAMLVELAPPGRRSFYAGTQMAAQILTIALATGAVLLLGSWLSPAALERWGWRMAFGLGALIAPLGVYMRAHMAESPEFVAAQQERQRVPIDQVLRSHGGALAGIAGIVVISAAALYFVLVFMPVYATTALALPARQVQLVTIACACAEVPVILIAARLADRFGAMALMLPAAAIWALAAWPLYAWLIAAPSIGRLLGAQLLAVLLLGTFSGPMPAFLSSLLPVEVRSSGIGLVFNAIGAVFGGLGPLLMTAMVAASGNPTAPAWWAALTGAVGAVTMATMALLSNRAEAGRG